jgi:hypothetical protein
MIRGTLQPEPIRFYTQPVMAALSYVDIHKDPFPTPEEAQVWFQLNGEQRTAFVPLEIVDEERKTVWAALVGEYQGKIVVSFPPTNFGQTKFSAEESHLEKIVKEVRNPEA